MSRSFRASLILILVALGTGLAAVAGWRYARVSAPVSGPIVLISVDALRADRVARAPSVNGTVTPALDALAADGVVFDRAYTHTPQALPAHVSLLSGRRPFESGVRDDTAMSIPGATRLLAEMLADRGYATGAVVSSFVLRRDTGLSRGFTFYDDELPEAHGSGAPVVYRQNQDAEARAERWLSTAATARAFLFLHLAEPAAGSADGLDAYAARVRDVDATVGRLVSYLKTQQLYEQATVIVVGAQGESLGAHGEHGHGLLVFDDTIHVPLIIKPPSGTATRPRVDTVVQHIDLVPTVLDLVKAPVPSSLPGQSLRAVMEGRDLPARLAYAESRFAHTQFGWSPLTTITDGRFRLIVGSEQALYDLAADPGLTKDVSTERPDVTATLADALRTLTGTATGSPAARSAADTAAHEIGPRERERFLALGLLGPYAVGQSAPQAAGAAPVDPHGEVAIVEAYRTAAIEIGSRRWNAGLDQLRALAERTPRYPMLWASLATLAGRANRHDVAADAYRRLVAASATSTEARLGLSQALFRARRLDDAKRHAELAAESIDPPVRARAHELLARIAVARKEPDSAREQAQQVAEADTSSPFPSYIEGRLLMDRGEYADAVERFDDAVAIVTKSGAEPLEELFLLRGDALAKLERPGEAEEAYLAELEHFPDSTRAMSALATLYHEQQRKDEAVAVLTRLVDTVGTAEAYEVAAQLWTSFGELERAAEVRSEAQRSLAPAPHAPATHQ